MEPLQDLLFLLKPAAITLIVTAIGVTFGSAFRALNYGKEMEKNPDFSEASITLDKFDAPMIPVMSSFTLLLMFYLFSYVSQILIAIIAIASVTCLFFWFSPYVSYVKSRFGLADPIVLRCCSMYQGLLLLACFFTVAAWLVTGHWILNNLLAISICIARVSRLQLPNLKVCAILFVSFFAYDIFWVFYSEMFFGANVMVTVATQEASNPLYTVANGLSLPGLQYVTKKLELPLNIIFPRNLLGGNEDGFMMIGPGDMAIPAMLLALVLCFEYRKSKEHSSIGHKYIWLALLGYAIGLVAALAASVLTRSPQPALLYLVPSSLGPVVFISWIRNELVELWEGTNMPNLNDKELVELSEGTTKPNLNDKELVELSEGTTKPNLNDKV